MTAVCNVPSCIDGGCGAVPATDGTGCDDGNPCTSGTTCLAGSCTGGTSSCAVPTGIVWGSPADAGASDAGSVDGGESPNECPAGQVLVGFKGTLVPNYGGHTWIASMQGLCATLALRWDVAGQSYVLVTTGAATLSNVNSGTGFTTSTWTRSCPSGQILVGHDDTFDSSDDQVNSIVFRCATLDVVRSGGAWQIHNGGTTDLTAVGSNYPGLSTELAQADCAAGGVAVGQQISVGGGSVTSVTLTCAAPSLTLSQ